MPRKRYPVNAEKLKSLRPFLDLVEVDLRRIEAEVDLLDRDYRNERESMAKNCPHTRRHAGLYLRFDKRFSPNGQFPLASVSWRVGNVRHNTKAARLGIAASEPRTRRIKGGGRNLHYRKSDLRAAMPYAQKWERDLTWRYEGEAKKLREFCFYLQKVADVMTWYPQIPSIPLLSQGRRETE